jgi:hypothetical protein
MEYLASMRPRRWLLEAPGQELGPNGNRNETQADLWHERTRHSFFELLGMPMYNQPQVTVPDAKRAIMAYVWLTNQPDVFSDSVRPDSCKAGCVGITNARWGSDSQWSEALRRGRHIRDRVRGYLLNKLYAEHTDLRTLITDQRYLTAMLRGQIDLLHADKVQLQAQMTEDGNDNVNLWSHIDRLNQQQDENQLVIDALRHQLGPLHQQQHETELANEALHQQQHETQLVIDALRHQLIQLREHALVSLLTDRDLRVRNGVGHAFLCGIAVLAREPVKHHLQAQGAPWSSSRAWMGFANEMAHPMFESGSNTNVRHFELPWHKPPNREVVDYFNLVAAPFLRLPIRLSVHVSQGVPPWEYVFQKQEVDAGGVFPSNLPLVGPLSRIGVRLAQIDPASFGGGTQEVYEYQQPLIGFNWALPQSWWQLQRPSSRTIPPI